MSFIYDKYDKHKEHEDKSSIGKLEQKYWKTKQNVLYNKLGKKEDEYVVASDNDLDVKLEYFEFIKTSSNQLLQLINKYQEILTKLSYEENELSYFLKEYSNIFTITNTHIQTNQYDSHDNTYSNNNNKNTLNNVCVQMLKIIGNLMKYSSKQRMQLQVPLNRLHNEIDTYLKYAYKDTQETIVRMEETRQAYRSTLLWMKDVSLKNIDPEMDNKLLEKYRRIQTQVKLNKQKFDFNKENTLDKIDLFSTSRSNMYSNVILAYLNTYCNYSFNLSNLFNQVYTSINLNQLNYEFNIIKELNSIDIDANSHANDHANTLEDDVNNENKNETMNENHLIDLNDYSNDIDFELEWNKLFNNDQSHDDNNLLINLTSTSSSSPTTTTTTTTTTTNNSTNSTNTTSNITAYVNDDCVQLKKDEFLPFNNIHHLNESEERHNQHEQQKWFNLFSDLDPLENKELFHDNGL